MGGKIDKKIGLFFLDAEKALRTSTLFMKKAFNELGFSEKIRNVIQIIYSTQQY